MNEAPILRVEGLRVSVSANGQRVPLVDNVSLDVQPGQVLGLMGETGAGKSLTAWASIRLPPSGTEIDGGDVWFNDKPLLRLPEAELRKIRGNRLTIIGQNPKSALNPMLSIGRQLANVYLTHNKVSMSVAWSKAVQALRMVQIPDALRRAKSSPHELSGGMAQRVLIAMALINKPSLLIADEPTTGLDVTVQADVLDLLLSLAHKARSAIWLITHDLGVVANYADTVVVMFAGRVVEQGPVQNVFSNPIHPYTKSLLAAASLSRNGRSTSSKSDPPNLLNPLPGCRFAYRCPVVESACRTAEPDLAEVQNGVRVRCILAKRTENGPHNKQSFGYEPT